MASQVVQYVIVRGDLMKILNWPTGALIAQCCHATTLVNHMHRDDPDTIEYFVNFKNMHKVVLEAKNEMALTSLSNKLNESGIKHTLWIEEPENIPTCIAIKPYQKDIVKNFVKKFNLYK